MTRRLTAASLALVLGAVAVVVGVVLTSSESTAAVSKVYVMPHFLEKKGLTTNTDFTFDTTVFMTYMTGVLSGGGTPTTVELYLYKNNGDLMTADGGTVVCNPCVRNLSDTKRKESYRLDDLIVARGGFPNNKVITGYGLIVVGGDPDGVSLQGFVTNAHTSPFDLSVFGFDPVPLQGTP